MTPLDRSVSFPICGAPHLQITKSNQAEKQENKRQTAVTFDLG